MIVTKLLYYLELAEKWLQKDRDRIDCSTKTAGVIQKKRVYHILAQDQGDGKEISVNAITKDSRSESAVFLGLIFPSGADTKSHPNHAAAQKLIDKYGSVFPKELP